MVGSPVFANRVIATKTDQKENSKPLSFAERKAAIKKWEATADDIQFKKWEASTAGKKVHSDAAKILKSVKDFTNMEGVVTSLTLPEGSRLGYGLMVKIKDVDYILTFGVGSKNEFKSLRKLKVNDKIIIKSHGISYAPKYAYPIVAGDYVEQNHTILYKRVRRKGGC
jgi:hypothetical protein